MNETRVFIDAHPGRFRLLCEEGEFNMPFFSMPKTRDIPDYARRIVDGLAERGIVVDQQRIAMDISVALKRDLA